LSGGQRRRLQLLVVLLSEPNVLVLDEPTNDLDTDMLASLEDLLDSWPGTLIVVSHDRYLMERVTDQQYAVLDGGLRHLPGGVDEYIAIARGRTGTGGGVGTFGPESGADAGRGSSPAAADVRPASEGGLDGADLRSTQKEIAAVERRLKKVMQQKVELNAKMAAHDPLDYPGLAALAERLPVLDAEAGELEDRWLDLTDRLG